MDEWTIVWMIGGIISGALTAYIVHKKPPKDN